MVSVKSWLELLAHKKWVRYIRYYSSLPDRSRIGLTSTDVDVEWMTFFE